jgi:hypothetical protein
MSKSILKPFEDYQKARFSFVQTIADLATRPQNIIALHSAGVMSLLRPLLLDSVQVIQQSAALAIGRLANYSEEIAESVIQNDIITQLIYSLSNQNRFYKKAACYVLRAVAKHSDRLADDVVKSGALDPLIQNLSEFDVGVKESAAWALGYIAKHSDALAQQVVEAKAVFPLIMCLQEPEITLKRACSQTLSYICQHSEGLATQIADSGIDKICFYLTYNDVSLKRNICLLLGNIAKHSSDLADKVWSNLSNPKYLLACLLDSDLIIKKNAAFCICEIVNKGFDKAKNVVNIGGLAILTNLISTIKGEARLFGIIALGFIAAHDEKLAEAIINCETIPHLKDALENETEHNLKAAACYALGKIGQHAPKHAERITEYKVLPTMLRYLNDPESSEDLKLKSKKSLKLIIQNCGRLEHLEPLIPEAPVKILKKILDRFELHMKTDKEQNKGFKKRFYESGGLKTLLEIQKKYNDTEHFKDKDREDLKKITDIAMLYDPEIIKFLSPDYRKNMLEEIERYNG